jgi:hypothetical protein
MNHVKSVACALAIATAMLVGNVNAQQVPIPTTAAEVPGPMPGLMTKAYVQMIGRMAYFWGWPLAYVFNQRTTPPRRFVIDIIAPYAKFDRKFLTG